jgi:small-conductance mechanosensitive channel
MAASSSTPPAKPPATPIKELGSNIIDNPGLWLKETLGELSVTLKVFLPDLLWAIAILIIGWLCAFFVRWLIQRFGRGLDAILNTVHRWLGQETSRPRWSFSTLVGNISYWIILVYAVSSAAEQLGMNTFANWVLELLGYLPRVLISAFILFMGYLIGNGIRNIILAVSDTRDFHHGVSLGHLVSGLIIAFALLLSLSQLGLDVTVFANIITLAAAALFGSGALAFGIGASDAVRNIMASHYVRKAYKMGQKIRLEELEGEILEMTQVDVVLETSAGEARIPARYFLEHVSLIVDEE